MRWILCALFVAISFTASAEQDVNQCLLDAAKRYAVSPRLLWSIAKVESGFNPRATNINTNGSMDIGLMQINTGWLPTLSRYGITRDHLFDPCVSLYVGAWVMAQNIQRHGPTLKALGAYNAVDPDKQLRYVRKVLAAVDKSYEKRP